jgi:hypothetical protein
MKEYQAPAAFFADLKALIDRWCDQRKLQPLSRLLPGYLSMNGLTDGWANLYDGLMAARALGHEFHSPKDWDTLNDLIHYSEGVVYRR